VDTGPSKVAANVQDAGECAVTNTVAPAAQPAALAHI